MHALKIGRRGTFQVADLEEASRVYQRVRDASGEGGSTFPNGSIDRGRWYISYNGNVWNRGKWTPTVGPVLYGYNVRREASV